MNTLRKLSNDNARIRALVKRIQRKYGYPPDKREQAKHTTLEQAKLLCEAWV